MFVRAGITRKKAHDFSYKCQKCEYGKQVPILYSTAYHSS